MITKLVSKARSIDTRHAFMLLALVAFVAMAAGSAPAP
jgi:hypothetical protein